MNKAWAGFMNPIIFGKADEKMENLPDFKGFFNILAYINANVAGPKSNDVYKLMMGASWSDKVKLSVKKTAAKVKIHLKHAGSDIAKGANKVKDWFKKAGKSVAAGAKKAAAALKGGVKLNVKAPKVTVKAGAKAAPKAKVSVKAGAKATPKAKVGVKAKTRRLQANKPADKPADKKTESSDVPTMNLNKDGLPVSEYKDDVTVPKELLGAKDQEAPKSANLVKLCFMLFAALLT